MHIRRLIQLIILVIFTLWIDIVFHLPNYISIIFLSISFYGIWWRNEIESKKKLREETNELTTQMKSNANDAYLKNKQILTIGASIPFPMLLFDEFGTVVLYNERFHPFRKGNEPDTFTYLHNDVVDEVKDVIKDAFILEKEFDMVITIKETEYQMMSIPIRTKGKFSGCLILFQNISKTLEGEKMQKRFIADASHELKTPISVIKGMVEILNRDDFHDETLHKDFLNQIENETTRLNDIVQDLLQLSRLSVEMPILNREKVDIPQLILTVCKSLRSFAKQKEIEFEYHFETDELLFCDAQKMSQVFTNIISNALKYSDHGKVKITCEIIMDNYIIKVRDYGIGIKESDQEKIFHRFYRVDKDRSRASGGSGLGLAISKKIMDAHNGGIIVLSEYMKGSTFTIYLHRS